MKSESGFSLAMVSQPFQQSIDPYNNSKNEHMAQSYAPTI